MCDYQKAFIGYHVLMISNKHQNRRIVDSKINLKAKIVKHQKEWHSKSWSTVKERTKIITYTLYVLKIQWHINFQIFSIFIPIRTISNVIIFNVMDNMIKILDENEINDNKMYISFVNYICFFFPRFENFNRYFVKIIFPFDWLKFYEIDLQKFTSIYKCKQIVFEIVKLLYFDIDNDETKKATKSLKSHLISIE